MDHWHVHLVCTESANDLGRWATLEGKSPTMRHDLQLRYAAQPKAKKALVPRIGITSEFIIGLLEVWWRNRSR
jgi:hypothetical protein